MAMWGARVLTASLCRPVLFAAMRQRDLTDATSSCHCRRCLCRLPGARARTAAAQLAAAPGSTLLTAGAAFSILQSSDVRQQTTFYVSYIYIYMDIRSMLRSFSEPDCVHVSSAAAHQRAAADAGSAAEWAGQSARAVPADVRVGRRVDRSGIAGFVRVLAGGRVSGRAAASCTCELVSLGCMDILVVTGCRC